QVGLGRGVVHDRVHPAVLRGDPLRQLVDVHRVVHLDVDPDDALLLRVEFLRRELRLARIPGAEQDDVAERGELAADLKADTAARSGDHGDRQLRARWSGHAAYLATDGRPAGRATTGCIRAFTDLPRRPGKRGKPLSFTARDGHALDYPERPLAARIP